MTESPGPAPKPSRQALLRLVAGRSLIAVGLLAPPFAAGGVAGFWAGARGVPWLPTWLELTLLVCASGLVALLIGSWLEGHVLTPAAAGVRLRKRFALVLALAMIAAVARLGVFWTQASSPLTRLPRRDLEEAFELDRSRYLEHVATMDAVLMRVEGGRALASDGNQPLASDEERALLELWSGFHDSAFDLDGVRRFWEDWYRFDPASDRRQHVRAFLLTFAAELALYEKGARLTGELDRRSDAGRFLDAPHPAAGLPADTYSRAKQALLGLRDGGRVAAGAAYLELLESGLDVGPKLEDWGVAGLWRRCRAHLAAIDHLGLGARIGMTVAGDAEVLKRSVHHVWLPAQESVARMLGNTKVRRIGRYLIDDDLRATLVRDHLEPGDILLSRKNWYLSNVGLPGFWPHALLHLGSADELAAFLDVPEARAALRARHGVETIAEVIARLQPAAWARFEASATIDAPLRAIEAVSSGVVLHSLEDATGDYLAVLRPRLDRGAIALAVVEAFRHLGKPYDYDFDFATENALVCSELVWRAYRPADGKAGIEFPVARLAGRNTLPPHDIVRWFAATRGTDRAVLDFVAFIDARESERRAAFAGVDAFVATAERSKWDLFLD